MTFDTTKEAAMSETKVETAKIDYGPCPRQYATPPCLGKLTIVEGSVAVCDICEMREPLSRLPKNTSPELR
jgi:hypothetical protein